MWFQKTIEYLELRDQATYNWNWLESNPIRNTIKYIITKNINPSNLRIKTNRVKQRREGSINEFNYFREWRIQS